jgi:hypothetical protein
MQRSMELMRSSVSLKQVETHRHAGIRLSKTIFEGLVMFIKFDKSATCLSGQDKAAKKKPGEKEEAAKADFARMISEKKNGLARAAVNGGNRECVAKTCGKEAKNNAAATPKKPQRQEGAKEAGAGSHPGVKKETAAPTSRAQVKEGSNKESTVSSQALGEEGGKKESAAASPGLGGREEKRKNTFTSQTIGEEGGHDRTFSTIRGEAGGNNGFTTAAVGEEGGKDHTFTTQPVHEEGGKDQTFVGRPRPNDDSNERVAGGLTDSMLNELLGLEDDEDEDDDEDEEDEDFLF